MFFNRTRKIIGLNYFSVQRQPPIINFSDVTKLNLNYQYFSFSLHLDWFLFQETGLNLKWRTNVGSMETRIVTRGIHFVKFIKERVSTETAQHCREYIVKKWKIAP
jgi:hypothetical protein